jgi:putative transposase
MDDTSQTESSNLQRRKQLRSYNLPGHAHELTFSCFQRRPLLTKDRSRQWFIDAVSKARQKLDFAVWAYVIMPEHVHILVWPRQPVYEVRLIRTAFKVPVTRSALRYCRRRAPDLLERLKDAQPNGDIHYRFWQRGGGYDRNVIEPATLQMMIEYIHNNPVRRGLVGTPTDWIWSSARFYAGDRRVPLFMDPLPFLLDD